MIHPINLVSNITRERIAATLVSLFPLLYFFPATSGRLVLSPDDGILFNVPMRVTAARLVSDGIIPLWNPYIFSGMPLHAAMQGGILFPLNWWFLFFEAPTAANLMTLSSYSLAALGAFLYARRINLSISGSIATSLVWQLSGFLVGQISHINIVQTAAMLPWVLWALESFAQSGKRKWGLLTVVFVGLQAFVGHPQTLVYSLILYTAYVQWMALTHKELRKRYNFSFLFIVAGIGFAAVQILPTLELLRNSIRSDATYEFFSSFSMPRRFMRAMFAPYIVGAGDGRLFRAPYISEPYYQEFIGYVGVVSLMLATCAVFIRRDKRTLFWMLVALVSFVLALGKNLPLDLYRLVYLVPVVNLFRVPSRHLMEVDFALAVLAGKGLTELTRVRIASTEKRKIAIVGGAIALLTCLVVTVFRPSTFRLARELPVTLLRAPELFMPILMAVLSLAALLAVAFKRRGAVAFLLVVLVFDLSMWGQFSGWYHSPKRTDEVWQNAPPLKALREVVPKDPSSYRILTAPHEFDPASIPIPPSVSHSSAWTYWTQADAYMAHGFHNAGGYDGFGLDRYGRLAGEMKVWGELTDPERTLRGPSRELDVLNVRYLISMRKQSSGSGLTGANAFPPATQEYDGVRFSQSDLGLPNIKPGSGVQFAVPPVESDMVALVTNLSWSENVPEGTSVGTVRLVSVDGRTLEFSLKAGADTSEWARERSDIKSRIRHKRPRVASSYTVDDTLGRYQAYTYLSTIQLPEKTTIATIEIVTDPVAVAPDLVLSVFRVSLADKGAQQFYPLGRDMLVSGGRANGAKPSERWRLVTRTNETDIYENNRSLPRAWLTTSALPLDELQTLGTIRTGVLSNGKPWDPAQTALVEPAASVSLAGTGVSAPPQITRYEPNRIDITTSSDAPTLLVLSENHYPGWRAYVDGQNVGVLRVNYNLRGVLLPAGSHQVSFTYLPKSALIGLLITILAVVITALWASGLFNRRLRRSTTTLH